MFGSCAKSRKPLTVQFTSYRETRGQPGAVPYRKETELLQYFELQVSERHKVDEFLMFHFKIITMDLFLKKYIKWKLFQSEHLWKGYIWRPVAWGAIRHPCVSLCHNWALEAISYDAFLPPGSEGSPSFLCQRHKSLILQLIPSLELLSFSQGPEVVSQLPQICLHRAYPNVYPKFCLSCWCIY